MEFGQAALIPLQGLLQHPEVRRRAHAADILGLLGESAAAPALTEALLDTTWEVRFAALSALGHLTGEEARQGIEQATHLADSRLRAVAQRLAANRPEQLSSLQEKLKQRREKGEHTRA